MKELYCPYCGSKIFHPYEERYECEDCGCLFDEEDIEREALRHQLSPMLNDTSEEAPMEIYFMIPSAEEEACGLSSLEIPHIDKVFEVEGDGTMWYHIEGEYVDNEILWHDIDELELEDLRALVEEVYANDEPTFLGGKKWDELSEHDKGIVADLEF